MQSGHQTEREQAKKGREEIRRREGGGLLTFPGHSTDREAREALRAEGSSELAKFRAL